MRRKAAAVLAVLVLLSTACGYAMSGTWNDDPENWHRAFRSTRPSDVVVVHSRYWRSPHWSYEFEYFFEIAPNAALKQQLFTANTLRQLTGKDAVEARARVFGDAPPWFAPKSLASYEVWVPADDPRSNFKVIIDKASGHIFLTDYQV
jgi:hypothetical protein